MGSWAEMYRRIPFFFFCVDEERELESREPSTPKGVIRGQKPLRSERDREREAVPKVVFTDLKIESVASSISQRKFMPSISGPSQSNIMRRGKIHRSPP